MENEREIALTKMYLLFYVSIVLHYNLMNHFNLMFTLLIRRRLR